MKSDTSASSPEDYTSDETEKRNTSHVFTSSDVESFKFEQKKKGSQEKVMRKVQDN